MRLNVSARLPPWAGGVNGANDSSSFDVDCHCSTRQTIKLNDRGAAYFLRKACDWKPIMFPLCATCNFATFDSFLYYRNQWCDSLVDFCQHLLKASIIWWFLMANTLFYFFLTYVNKCPQEEQLHVQYGNLNNSDVFLFVVELVTAVVKAVTSILVHSKPRDQWSGSGV